MTYRIARPGKIPYSRLGGLVTILMLFVLLLAGCSDEPVPSSTAETSPSSTLASAPTTVPPTTVPPTTMTTTPPTTVPQEPDIAWVENVPPDFFQVPLAVNIGEDIQGELEEGHDSDFFRFEAEQGVTYQIDMALGDSEMWLYDADGGWLDSDYGNDTASRIVWNAPTSGVYYIEATSYGPDVGTYTLTVSELVNDHANVIEGATLVNIGEGIQGELEEGHDSDFFRFEAEQGVTYQIDMALGDSEMWLYDADGGWLDSDYGNDTASRIVWNAPTSGVYYVEASSYGPDVGTYTLTVSELVDDHANVIEGASLVNIGEGNQGEIEHGSDRDFFLFEAEQGVTYQIDIALGALGDSEMWLYDADGVQLDSNDDYGNGPASRIVWNAPTSGVYYVEASSYATDVGTYTLTIAVQ